MYLMSSRQFAWIMFKVNMHTDIILPSFEDRVKTPQSTKIPQLIIPEEINRGKSQEEILSCIQRESEKEKTKAIIIY
jgi:hypothetical protein